MNVAIVLAGLTPRAKQIDGMGFGGAPAWKFEDRVTAGRIKRPCA